MTALDRQHRVVAAAVEVRKYWRDWPQERRDAVRRLSRFLADALEELSAATGPSIAARGMCPVCRSWFVLTAKGVVRHHLGTTAAGRFRQVCDGVGREPLAVAS